MAKAFKPTFDFRSAPTLQRFLQRSERIRTVIGPLGSGKSTACCAAVMAKAFEQKPDPRTNYRQSRIAIVRNTAPDLKSTTIKTWQECFPEEAVGPIRWSSPITHRITVKPKGGEPGLDAEFVFVPLDKPADVRKLRGMDLTAAWVSEASEVPKGIIQMLRGRVGRYPPAGRCEAVNPAIFLESNAPDEDNWLAQYCLYELPEGWAFERQPPAVLELAFADGEWKCVEPEPHLNGLTFNKAQVIPGAGRHWAVNPDTENAPFLRTGYYADQISGAGLDWIRAYLQGRFVYVQDGKPVIPEYTDNFYSTDDVPILTETPLSLGLDIGGGTLNPAAVIGQRHPRGNWLIHDEVAASDTGIENFVVMLKERITRLAPGKAVEVAWSDPAMTGRDELYEVAIADHLQAKGIPAFPAPSNDPSLRIEAIKGACQRYLEGWPGLLIHTRCKQLRKALNGAWMFRRVQVTGEERYQDKPAKTHPYSDLGDALGYLVLGGGGHSDLTGRNARNRQAGQAVVEFDVFG